MSKIIRIENLIKQSFNIMYEHYPWGGRWRTLSQGLIHSNLGDSGRDHSDGTWSTYHLLLFAQGETKANGYLFRLNDFGDLWSENDVGEGLLAESWGLAFRGGYIKWEVVKMPNVS